MNRTHLATISILSLALTPLAVAGDDSGSFTRLVDPLDEPEFYCLSVGPDSTKADGPSHLWRALRVAKCANQPDSMVMWQVGL